MTRTPMEMAATVTLSERIGEIALQHGGYRPAARALGLDHVYLWRLGQGVRRAPSAAILKKLGLESATLYFRTKGA
jgi:hypothetical protein